MSNLAMQVEQTEALTPRIRRLVLSSVDGAPVPAYTAGAHIELHVPADGARRAMRRAYSLVTPADGGSRYEIAVQLEPEGTGGSRWVHTLQCGDRLTVSTPKNHFPLADRAEQHLLLAGGIGVTPILCMARTLQQAGHCFELHYAARERALAAYRDAIDGLGGRCWFDGGDPRRGMPLDATIAAPAARRHLYVCGPKSFIAAVLESARRLGWAEDQLHCELFSGALDVQGDQPFTVELSQSGVTLEVPVGKTVMDVMEDKGLETLFDCRRGECGVCVAKVLTGEADHRDICLSPRERESGSFCTCVSRARSARLVLDL